jgi:hypothetical protein
VLLEELAQEIAGTAVVIDDEDMGVGLHGATPAKSRAIQDGNASTGSYRR